jgi:hypothetical protein
MLAEVNAILSIIGDIEHVLAEVEARAEVVLLPALPCPQPPPQPSGDPIPHPRVRLHQEMREVTARLNDLHNRAAQLRDRVYV